MGQKAALDPSVLTKELSTYSLTNTHPKPHQRDRSPKSIRDTQDETELSGFRARAGETALSGTEVLTGIIVPLLSVPPE